MSRERNFKVYMHKNKMNGKVYIGITGQKLKYRWREGKGYKGCRAFNAAIKKYGWDTFEHILLLDNLTKEEAEEKEIELIKKYKSNKKGYGYNISNGGSTIGSHSEETKKILSEKAKGRKSKNAKKVICENIVFENANKCADYYGVKVSTLKSWLEGMTMPKEWFDKGLRREGKSMEDYTIQRGRHGNPKPVICENIEYRSCDECSEHYGINSGTMKNWLNGRNPMPKEWYEKGLRYKEKSIEDYVVQKTTDEEPIVCENKTFGSFKECSDYYNIDINLLRKWLRRELNMPQNFYDMGLRHKSKTIDYYTRRTRDFSGIKQVVCEDMIFENIVSCADYYKVKATNLASYLTGRTTMPKEWYEKGLKFIDKTMDDYKVRPDNYIGENSPLPTNPIICDDEIFYSVNDFLKKYPEAKNIYGWLNGISSMPKEWEKRGLKYLDGHTDDIIMYQDEEYWEIVHKNRSDCHKGYIPINSFKVYCEGMVFDTIPRCAKYYGINSGTMKHWVNGSGAMPQEWYDKGLRREDKKMSDYKIQRHKKKNMLNIK